jgi:hypothetical protein
VEVIVVPLAYRLSFVNNIQALKLQLLHVPGATLVGGIFFTQPGKVFSRIAARPFTSLAGNIVFADLAAMPDALGVGLVHIDHNACVIACALAGRRTTNCDKRACRDNTQRKEKGLRTHAPLRLKQYYVKRSPRHQRRA